MGDSIGPAGAVVVASDVSGQRNREAATVRTGNAVRRDGFKRGQFGGRARRALSATEMNTLLRQREATPHPDQCSRARRTYVELKLADLERLVGRR
jgi:DNA mismatch repair ATPase MutL